MWRYSPRSAQQLPERPAAASAKWTTLGSCPSVWASMEKHHPPWGHAEMSRLSREQACGTSAPTLCQRSRQQGAWRRPLYQGSLLSRKPMSSIETRNTFHVVLIARTAAMRLPTDESSRNAAPDHLVCQVGKLDRMHHLVRWLRKLTRWLSRREKAGGGPILPEG